jgi:hypothetical protein
MTDERITRFPDDHPDDRDTDNGEARRAAGDRSRPTSDEEERNPLLREGPDALDAADIEDPEEQL